MLEMGLTSGGGGHGVYVFFFQSALLLCKVTVTLAIVKCSLTSTLIFTEQTLSQCTWYDVRESPRLCRKQRLQDGCVISEIRGWRPEAMNYHGRVTVKSAFSDLRMYSAIFISVGVVHYKWETRGSFPLGKINTDNHGNSFILNMVLSDSNAWV